MLCLATAVCSAPPADPDAPAPRPRAEVGRPDEVYGDLGLIAGPDRFPAVASIAAVAGPADTAFVLLGLSLSNRLLRFQREGDGFTARYRVSLRFARDSQTVRLVDRAEAVRVASFAETTRADPTVVFQAGVPLAPGRYTLTLRVRDGLSGRGFERRDTVRVPDFSLTGVAAPIPVHRAGGRADRSHAPDLVLSPRHLAEYGGDPPTVYLERYDGSVVRVELTGEDGRVAWEEEVELEPGAELAAGVAAIPVDSLSLGRFWIRSMTEADTSVAVPLVISLRDSWVVDHLDQVLALLRYIAPADEVEALEAAAPEARRQRWEALWDRLDPVPATPLNELREAFLERVRVAARDFAEAGRPGWLTDRGEVYIVLGPPGRTAELRVGDGAVAVGRPDAREWVYDRVPGGGRLTLVFVDRFGFGSWELTPTSSAAFRNVADRIRKRRGAS